MLCLGQRGALPALALLLRTYTKRSAYFSGIKADIGYSPPLAMVARAGEKSV